MVKKQEEVEMEVWSSQVQHRCCCYHYYYYFFFFVWFCILQGEQQ